MLPLFSLRSPQLIHRWPVSSVQRFVFTMRSLQGALIIAGVFQAVVGFFGIWRVFIRLVVIFASVVTLSIKPQTSSLFLLLY